MLFQFNHCRAIPSCESNILVSTIFPSGPGTLIRRPLVRTPSQSMRRRRMREASCSMLWGIGLSKQPHASAWGYLHGVREPQAYAWGCLDGGPEPQADAWGWLADVSA